MATWSVGIAVNGTVHVEVEADSEEEAMDKGEAKFFEDFDANVAQVGSKACSAETAETI